jgi:hypothetical protein
MDKRPFGKDLGGNFGKPPVSQGGSEGGVVRYLPGRKVRGGKARRLREESREDSQGLDSPAPQQA